jgi:Lrp/AsnC family leucine-responsive transcriptional regulator
VIYESEPQALGYQLQAIVGIRPMPGKPHIVQKLIEEIPEFCECDKVTGLDYFFSVSWRNSMR